MLRIAEKYGCECFVYISTAYSCGRPSARSVEATSVIEDGSARFSSFNNVYERSKALAEEAVQSSDVPSLIIRPSILVHEPANGANAFCSGSSIGLYGWLKLVDQASKISLKDGSCELRLQGFIDAHLDFIDVDRFANIVCRMCQRLARMPWEISIPTVPLLAVSGNPVRVDRVVSLARTYLGNRVLNVCRDLSTDTLSSGERIYSHYAGFFTSYASQYLIFKPSSTLASFLGDDELSHGLGQPDIEDCTRQFACSVGLVQQSTISLLTA